MENSKIQFRSKACNLHLSAYPGHFATKQSHVNYFLDMTTLKVRQSNAAVSYTHLDVYKRQH